jgi:hypothetical protein
MHILVILLTIISHYYLLLFNVLSMLIIMLVKLKGYVGTFLWFSVMSIIMCK